MPIDGYELKYSPEEPKHDKNITSKILGKEEDIIDFDTRMPQSDFKPESDGIEQQDLTGDNALVNVLDLFISTSPMILSKYGYPSPDLRIWKEWAKPNLNIMFNHYFPAGSGTAVASPVMAGMVGIAALGLCALPVIMEFIKRRNDAKAEAALQPPEGIPEDAQIPDDQIAAPVEVQPEPEPMDSATTDVSDHQLTVSERMATMEQQVV